jgi:hypothetical protein
LDSTEKAQENDNGDHPLIQLLALIDMVWIETEKAELRRGAPKYYSEKTMFKVYVVSLLRKSCGRDARCGVF